MSAESLAGELLGAGISCRVEALGRLAVVVADPEVGALLGDPALRRRVLEALPRHGFTHIALELPRSPSERASVHRR